MNKYEEACVAYANTDVIQLWEWAQETAKTNYDIMEALRTIQEVWIDMRMMKLEGEQDAL
jgi:hypothetical protein